MNTDRLRRFSPVPGKTFEAIKVGNVVAKIYKREHATAKDKNRESCKVADYTAGSRKRRRLVLITNERTPPAATERGCNKARQRCPFVKNLPTAWRQAAR